MRLGVPSVETMWLFGFCWRVTGGLLRLLVAVRGGRSPWPNAKTSPAESPVAARGSNENTNGLLRQYLPKNADLSCNSQSDLDEIALRLNQRPRKTLGFQTPADKLQASVASTLEITGLSRIWPCSRQAYVPTFLGEPAAPNFYLLAAVPLPSSGNSLSPRRCRWSRHASQNIADCTARRWEHCL
jgi:hypothetical protein